MVGVDALLRLSVVVDPHNRHRLTHPTTIPKPTSHPQPTPVIPSRPKNPGPAAAAAAAVGKKAVVPPTAPAPPVPPTAAPTTATTAAPVPIPMPQPLSAPAEASAPSGVNMDDDEEEGGTAAAPPVAVPRAREEEAGFVHISAKGSKTLNPSSAAAAGLLVLPPPPKPLSRIEAHTSPIGACGRAWEVTMMMGHARRLIDPSTDITTTPRIKYNHSRLGRRAVGWGPAAADPGDV